MRIDGTTLKTTEPPFSQRAHASDDWEPNWTTERFSLYLRCIEESCGEVVIVSGDTALIEVADEDLGWTLETVLRPRAMFPAPPIIQIPDKTPYDVARQIQIAFALFWMNIGSGANCLRVSVEKLLDHLGVSGTHVVTKNGKTKTLDLDLNGRIQLYGKNNPGHGKTFDALRMIGNLGSHGSVVTREAVIDAFEIYEDALSVMFSGHKERLEVIKEKIIKNKGAY